MNLTDMIQVPSSFIIHRSQSLLPDHCSPCPRSSYLHTSSPRSTRHLFAVNVTQGELVDDELDVNMAPLLLVDLLEKGISNNTTTLQ